MMPIPLLAVQLALAPAGARQGDDLPARLEYSNGNGLFGSESIVWRDGRLIWMRLGHNGAGGRDSREEAIPPAGAWRTFWRRLDSAKVWSWDSAYHTTGSRASAQDGYVWKVAVAHNAQSVASSGYNAMAPGADALREALEDLFVASRRVGREWEPDRLGFFVFGLGPEVSYQWTPTRVAVTYENLEPRRIDGRTRTEPADLQVHLIPGALTTRVLARDGTIQPRTVTPSPDAWERFWARLDAEQVSHVLPDSSIPPDSSVPFEWSWSVDLQHGDDRITAKGRGRRVAPPIIKAIRAALDQLVADAAQGTG